ncbi:MAG: hypothetical protein K5912_02575 [Alphaproteobacteria bacterium]|nr:hypothetical protein [Alphaproteobacteria bacterium]
MSEEKKQEFIKIIRAIVFSAGVVAFCIFYRESKQAEKQKREDASFVKDFSEFVLWTAAQEAHDEMYSVENLEKSYSLYSIPDLIQMLDVMSADSARYAQQLVRDSDLGLKWRGQDFPKILNNIKSVSNFKSDTNILSKVAAENRFTNNYAQYKQHIQILSVARKVLSTRR